MRSPFDRLRARPLNMLRAHRPRFHGLYFDEFTTDSAWIREAGWVELPPLPGVRTVTIEGCYVTHPEATGSLPRLSIAARSPRSATAATVWPEARLGDWRLELRLPEGAAEDGAGLLLKLHDVALTNFYAWLGRITGMGSLQKYRSQNKNRQLRIRRIETDGGEVIYDFADRHGPYSTALARRQFNLGMNIVGFLTADLGIGESARSMVKAADAARIPTALVPMKLHCKNRLGDQTFADRLQDDNPYPVNVVHVDPPAAHDLRRHHGRQFFRGKHNIGYFAWESPEFPDSWVSAFRHFDEIWCPSDFARASMTWKSPVPVHTMPHAIDFSRPAEPVAALRQRFGLPADKFLFLCLFDLNSYAPRKNPQAAIDAFRAAALPAGTAGLVVKVQNAEGNPADFAALQAALAAMPGAILLNETLERADVYRLEMACDAFVSLHRAEGFGFAAAEAMYLGKPVIATDWSATAEYIDSTNGCPVAFQLKPLTESRGPYGRGSLWAEAEIDDAARWMRRIAGDREFCAQLGQAARRTIEHRFSPAAVGARYRQRLDNLALW